MTNQWQLIGPIDALNHLNWGRALANLKEYAKASEKFERALEYNQLMAEDKALAYFNWGRALANLTDDAKASEKFEQALALKSLTPNIEALAYFNWGLALANLKEYAKASEKYKETLSHNQLTPEDKALAYCNWAVALHNLQQYPEAIEKHEQAHALNQLTPEDKALAYCNWGLTLANQQQYPEAIEKYKEAIKLTPDIEALAYFNWGLTLANQQQYPEAIEKYEQALDADKDSLWAVYASHNKADLLWKQGRYAEGRKAWDKARERYKGREQKEKEARHPDYFQYYGWVLHTIFGELKEAEEIYSKGLKLDPNHVGILSGLVDLYIERKDEPVKEDDDVLQRTRDYWRAREFYKKAVSILEAQVKKLEDVKAEDVPTLLQLGELALKMEDNEKAQEYLTTALKGKKNEGPAAAYAALGVLFTRQEDFKQAAQYFDQAHRQDPDDLGVWSNLAETYLKLKLTEKAEKEYNKILRITSHHIDSQIGMGEVYLAMAEKDERHKDSDLYNRAILHFSEALHVAGSDKASKRLKDKEKGGAYYSRGYARVQLYEASKLLRDINLLHEAKKDFIYAFCIDPENHKARRAMETLERRLTHFSPQFFTEKVGPWLILSPSISMLLFSLYGLVFRSPDNNKFYATLSFASLAFMVIGLYLPQILKLEVAGIKLEKSSVDQITLSETLGISK